ncbi:MAG: VirB3 family type IV secretion system protein [Bryobacterales bacterium]|nr:VirB3 family type IV secretion system protein [Bryobacterales bacterium]MDE0434211.1 VirB3 family type IV secretion system protein [Bryobacterales bacterium]
MSLSGQRSWTACRSLSRPLTILYCERRIFILSVTIGGAAWNAMNSLTVGFVLAAVGYAVGVFGTRNDPNMLFVARAAAREKVRYDPGKRPDSMEAVEIAEGTLEGSA